MKRFRGGLVFEAHRLLYRSTLGLRVIKKKKKLLTLSLLAGYVSTDSIFKRASELYSGPNKNARQVTAYKTAELGIR